MAVYDKQKPYIITEEPGLKEYCMCNLSETPPYCDGSHNGKLTGTRPYMVKVEQTRQIAICGCGRSGRLPYCDQSHLRDSETNS